MSGAVSDEESFAINFSPKAFWKGSGSSHMAEEKLKRPNFLPIVSSTTLAQSLLKVRWCCSRFLFSIEHPLTARCSTSLSSVPMEKAQLEELMGLLLNLIPQEGITHHLEDGVFKSRIQMSLLMAKRTWLMWRLLLRLLKAFHFGSREVMVEKINCVRYWMEVGMVSRCVKCSLHITQWIYFVISTSYINRLFFLSQVGTLFALSNESGMAPTIKQRILTELATNTNKLHVFTDPAASPTGFPFKVLEFNGQTFSSLSDPEAYEARPRVCNLGYLRTPYLKANGEVGYRCPAEPVDDYVAKGGDVDETVGRKCLCNALCADAGFPQVRFVVNPVSGERELYVEPSLITTGNDINECKSLLKQNEDGTWGYSANDVVDYLLSGLEIDNESKFAPDTEPLEVEVVA